MKNFTIFYCWQGREYQANFPARSAKWAAFMAPLQLMTGAQVLRVEEA